MTADQWYARVRELAGHGGDLEAAFLFISGECARILGPGTTLWVKPGSAEDGKPLIHFAATGERSEAADPGLNAALEPLVTGRDQPAVVAPAGGLSMAHGGKAVVAVVVPLFACAGDMGVLVHLADHGDIEAVPAELLLLASVFAAQAANHGYVMELSQAKQWIEGELQQVAAIQQALLPDSDADIPGLSVASSFRAYSQAGGDYFDYLQMPGDPGRTVDAIPAWGAMIADAAGHGASASVEIAMLDAILRTYKGDGGGPAAVFNYANRHLFTRRIRGSFITAFAMNYGPEPGHITYASAGHNPPLLLRASGGPAEWLDASEGIPLGVMREFEWHNNRISAAPGDIILLYTDGVVETENRAGERFGISGLERVATAAGSEPRSVIRAVEDAVDRFRQGVRPQDDQTMLALRIEPEGGQTAR